jgi:hypothetical protein
MPSANKSVRIIQRKQREILVTRAVVTLSKTARQLEREMAQTVTSWIDERRELVKEVGRADSVSSLLYLRSKR